LVVASKKRKKQASQLIREQVMRTSVKTLLVAVSAAAVCGFVYAQGQGAGTAAGTQGGAATGVAGGQAAGAAAASSIVVPATVVGVSAAMAAAVGRAASASANVHTPASHKKADPCDKSGGKAKTC
jgi:hypothetical protein